MSCKLFDRVAFGTHPRLAEAEKFVLSINAVKRATLLDASDIYATYSSWWDATKRSPEQEFQRCLSPFRNVFVYAGEVGGIATGMHVESLREDDPNLYGKSFNMFQSCKMSVIEQQSLITGHGDAATSLLADIKACGEILRIIVWGSSGQCPVQAGIVVTYVVLSRDGRYVSAFAGAAKKTNGVGLFGSQSIHHSTFPLFVNQLMHCKNIVTLTHDPYRPAMPRGKRNKVPKITYRTLRISNSLSKDDAEEPHAGDGETAKHVCRGNFAHYTEENKLFGKYVGMFWRPMHIRGNAKHGIVGKEYKLDASRQ